MKTTKLFCIGERVNPQLKKSYYNAYGKLTKKQIKEKENCVYGSMYITVYDTKEAYENAKQRLVNDGFKVNNYEDQN
jgi:hypothetical protein